MGQYHLTVNLDKREFIHPHKLGNGLKLLEQTGSNVPAALFMLLAVSNGRGGGDFNDDVDLPLIGSWGGDRVAVVGDYAETSDLPPEFDAPSIYHLCSEHDDPEYPCEIPGDHEHYRDISEDLIPLLERYMGIKFVKMDGWRHFVKTCREHPDKAEGHFDHEAGPTAFLRPERGTMTLSELDLELRMGTPPEVLGISPEMAAERNNGWRNG